MRNSGSGIILALLQSVYYSKYSTSRHSCRDIMTAYSIRQQAGDIAELHFSYFQIQSRCNLSVCHKHGGDVFCAIFFIARIVINGSLGPLSQQDYSPGLRFCTVSEWVCSERSELLELLSLSSGYLIMNFSPECSYSRTVCCTC